MTDFLTVNDLRLEYITFGTGKKTLLAFHGFGRNANDFRVFKESFGEEYTVYSFNLFLHQGSLFPVERIEKKPLKKLELHQLVHEFLNSKSISEFNLAGYSLGGKIALAILELFPSNIHEVWLFAPDGIKKNPWYTFTSKTYIGRKAYQLFMKHPNGFIKALKSLQKTNIINQKLIKFALSNTESEEKRILVYNVWLMFRHIEPNIDAICNGINSSNVKIFQFYGKNDQVILPKVGLDFAKKIKQEDNYVILDQGHNLLTKNTNQIVRKMLLK